MVPRAAVDRRLVDGDHDRLTAIDGKAESEGVAFFQASRGAEGSEFLPRALNVPPHGGISVSAPVTPPSSSSGHAPLQEGPGLSASPLKSAVLAVSISIATSGCRRWGSRVKDR